LVGDLNPPPIAGQKLCQLLFVARFPTLIIDFVGDLNPFAHKKEDFFLLSSSLFLP
jgi:hypothetical protein